MNAPWVFRGFFRMVSTLFFPAKIRDRCHFIDNLEQIKDVVDADSLPLDVGGKLEFNADEWVNEMKQREADDSFTTMTQI